MILPLVIVYTVNSIPASSMGMLEFFGMLTIGLAAGSIGVI
jgi:hypothetical protein